MGRMKLKPKPRYELSATGESFDVKDGVDFTCPFCGGRVCVGDSTLGESLVMHTQPMCDKFRDEDPLVFLRNARVKVIGPVEGDEEYPIVPQHKDDQNDN